MRVRISATHRRILLLITLIGGGLLASCVGDDDLRTETAVRAIAFASVMGEQEVVTRAGNTLGHDFVVYGYKCLGDGQQMVFDGYTINYDAGSANTSADNTSNYHYVGGKQTIKYWDFAASEYRFWGYTGSENHFKGNGRELVIPVTGLLEENEPATPYFSSLYIRKPVTSDVVTLEFKRPYSKVRMLFYTSDNRKAGDEIELTNITFAPNDGKKIYKAGSVKVTFPLDNALTAETVVVVPSTNDADVQSELAYRQVTLSSSDGYAPDHAVTAKTTLAADGTEFYYTLPMGEKNPDFTLKLTINGDDEQKTAIVPASYMQWNPNVLYTYIFKVSGASKKVEFYDVKIDPWDYGGSQEETWTNW